MPILAILYTGGLGGGGGSSHSIHKAKAVGPQSPKGLALGIKKVITRDAR